jgi:hypothetical protein
MRTRRSAAHRTGAWLALFVFVGTLLAPVLSRQHNGLAADVACNEPGLAVGHPVTQFEAVLPSPLTDHCAICHWWRALRDASIVSPECISLDHAARQTRLFIVLARVSSTPATRHGRAPPLALS